MAKKALEQSLTQISLVRTTVDRYTSLARDTRRWWPVLIPFLLWRGKKAYAKELRKALAEEAEARSPSGQRAAEEARQPGGKPARAVKDGKQAKKKAGKNKD